MNKNNIQTIEIPKTNKLVTFARLPEPNQKKTYNDSYLWNLAQLIEGKNVIRSKPWKLPVRWLNIAILTNLFSLATSYEVARIDEVDVYEDEAVVTQCINPDFEPPMYDLSSFFWGLFLGILIGMTFMYLLNKVSRCCKSTKEKIVKWCRRPPPTPPTIAPPVPLTIDVSSQTDKVNLRHVRTQSQTSYTAVRGAKIPKFDPLREYEHGVWLI